MNKELLTEARRLAQVIGQRLHLRLPSILAEGEEFELKMGVTGPDAMPVEGFAYDLHFEKSIGIAGLPPTFRFDPSQSAASIKGLKATRAGVALASARVDAPQAPKPAVVYSNPAWISKDPAVRLFWGDLHIHTRYSNCSAWRCLDPEWGYQYARDVSFLDFAAAADHLRGIASDPARWPRLQELARLYNEPRRFVSFLAFESSHAQGYGGDNNVYFLGDDAPHFWVEREDMRGGSPQVHLRDLWQQMDRNKKPYFTVPHHTGRARKFRSWDEDCFDARREPIFEIYSSWGSSEMRHCRLPISGGNNDAPSYFVDALRAGARFGVIASSDDHATLPGSVHHFRLLPFREPDLNGFAHKGLAAIRCPALTRKDLFEAIMRRSVYATTQDLSLLEFGIGGAGMGQEIKADSSLRQKRQIRLCFTLHGADYARVILMRNGVEFESRAARGPNLMTESNEMIFEDADPLEKIVLRGAKFHEEPFAVYYARIEDGRGAHQWTSPIWIDLK